MLELKHTDKQSLNPNSIKAKSEIYMILRKKSKMKTLLLKQVVFMLFASALFTINATAVNSFDDSTPPIFSGPVRDGNYFADDLEVTFSTSELMANWQDAEDPDSGIVGYFYAIGTTTGGTDIRGWNDVGKNDTVTADGLQLEMDQTYYVSVYAVNGADLKSVGISSNGVKVIPMFKTGDNGPPPEETDTLSKSSIAGVTPNENATEKYSSLDSETEGLPPSAKNYLYLPAVGNQGSQGSCSGWATAYYYKTYQEAKEHNWIRPNVSVDPQHVMSPAFAYNIINGGTDSGGTPSSIMYYVLARYGCATWQDMPYNQSNWTNAPSETAWRNGILYKGQSNTSIYFGTDDGIIALKQLLADGDVAVIAMQVYPNFMSYPTETTGVNNGVLFSNTGTSLGGHDLVVIGYDDTKSYFDGTETKYGAFLIVNSWGSGWGLMDSDIGTKGFIWLADDFMRDHTYKAAHILVDNVGYAPTLYGIYGINHTSRGSINVSFLGGTSSSAPDWTSIDAMPMGGSIAINQRIVLDLTPYAFNFDDPFWLKVYDSSASPGTINYMAIEDAEGHITESEDIPKTTIQSGYVYSQLLFNTDYTPPASPMDLQVE